MSIEFVLIFVVLMTFVFITIQTAVLYIAYQVATVAASDAVDAAQIAGASEADGVAAANAYLSQSGVVTAGNVSVSFSGGEVFATVTGQPNLQVVPFPFTVTATATGSIEQFVSESDR